MAGLQRAQGLVDAGDAAQSVATVLDSARESLKGDTSKAQQNRIANDLATVRAAMQVRPINFLEKQPPSTTKQMVPRSSAR